MRVLGIDPGLTRCGLGVVDGPVAAPRHVAHRVVGTRSDTELSRRLQHVHDGVVAAIAEFRPRLVAVERVLFSRNVRTAMATGQALGVALLAAAQADLPVLQLTPTDVKLSVTGNGAADKDGVARLVTAQLRLAEVPRPADAADALAVALAALARSRMPTASPDRPDDGGRPGAAPAAAGSWEELIARRGMRVAGGTAAGDVRGGPA